MTDLATGQETRNDSLRHPGRFGTRMLGPVGHQVGLLLLIAILCAPAFTPAATVLRLALPALTFLISMVMLRRGRLGTYLSFVVWLTLLTPFVRRVVDSTAGWAESNPILLAPLTAALPSLFTIPSLINGRAKGLGPPFLALVAAVSYGLLITVVEGRFLEGSLDFMRWVLPPCTAALVVMNAGALDRVETDMEAICLLAVPLLSLYAAIQFMVVPRWDALWMINVDMQSIGTPMPFNVRVFSTMASPGPFANFLVVALIILLGVHAKARWIGLGSGIGALALTAVRSSWLALAIAAAYVVALAPSRARLSVVTGVCAAFLLLPAFFTTPAVRQMLVDRIASLTTVTQDASYEERAQQYAGFIGALNAEPWGRGLALRGTLKGETAANGFEVVDGGLIEIFASLGVIGGLVYLLSLLALFAATFPARIDQGPRTRVVLAQAIYVSSLLQLVSGMVFSGESSILMWIVLGTAMTRRNGAQGGEAKMRGVQIDRRSTN